MKKLPTMYSADDFYHMFEDAQVSMKAWWYILNRWREEGKLRPNEHYITVMVGEPKRMMYKYLRRPVLTLIYNDFPKNHFSRSIMLYYKEEIEAALSPAPEPAAPKSAASPKS